jgi:3-oxoacyl-[acyl-carrier protein] reductase
MELKGCAAIVTGGSGGLGQRICRALALAGVNVAVNYAVSEAKAKGIAADLSKLGVRALAIQADVTDPAAWRGWWRRRRRSSGGSTSW